MSSLIDPSTLSNYESFLTKDLALKIDVDFQSKLLFVDAVHHFQVCGSDELASLLLDSAGVAIEEISFNLNNVGDSYEVVDFTVLPDTNYIGEAVKVDLSKFKLKKGDDFFLRVKSATTDKCTGLQWMEKEETSGKKKPYVYSQCQSIMCRSIFPCQDSPGIKFTYSAEVKLDKELAVVMSGLRDGDALPSEDGKNMIHKFVQKQPIPAYLFAIAAGNLVKGDLGPRCAVWTEPEHLEQCVYEFAEVENILKIAEDICGPYLWQRYDFLVLPPTFPFGGMENPNITFLSPTLLAGDRSLVNVLAHEITHSWTGNLVTTLSWEHFWLNEGWTRFIEDKIKAAMEGDETVRLFLTAKELKHLNDDLENFKNDNKYELTALCPDLSKRSPEDAFSAVPYEKGSMLLRYVEQMVGGAEKFAPYIKNYIETFKSTPIDSYAWRDHLIAFFPEHSERLKSLPWSDIFTAYGPSVVSIDTTNSLTTKCIDIANMWANASVDEDFCKIKQEFPGADKYSVDMKHEILELIREKQLKWPLEKFNRLGEHLGLKGTKNCELLTPWIRIGLHSEIDDMIDVAVDLVKTVGRMKFARVTYRALYAWEKSRPIAIETFNQMKPFMNPITAHWVSVDLKITQP